MADNQVDDTGTAPADTGGASASAPSFDADKLQKSLDGLSKGIQTLEARVNGLQGNKDTEISALRKQITEYENLKEQLGAEGAMGQLDLKQTLADVQSKLSQLTQVPTEPAPVSANSGAIDSAHAIKMLDEYGLPANTPEFLDMVREGLTEQGVKDYVLAHKKAVPPASPSGIATPAATGTPPPPPPEGLREEYEKKFIDARGNKALQEQIRAEYAEKGVLVDKIVFSV